MSASRAELGFIGLLAWVLRYALHFPREMSAVLALSGISIVLNLLKPLPVVFLIDHVLKAGPAPDWAAPVLEALPGASSNLGLVSWAAGATIAIFVLDWLAGLGSKYASFTLGERLTYRVSAEVFKHLQKLSIRHHSRSSVGDAVRRVTTDCGSITTIFRDALLPVLTSSASMLVMFSVLWSLNSNLAALSLLVIPYMAFVFKRYSAPMLERSYEEDESEGGIYSFLEQTFSAMPAVQAFGREYKNEEHFVLTTRRALRAAVSSVSIQLKFKILMAFATAAGTAAVLWFGARAALEGSMTVGSIVLFLSYLASFYGPLEAIMYTGSTIQSAGGGARRVLEVLSLEPDIIEQKDALPLIRPEGRVEFDRVSFAYRKGQPTLRDVSLHVEPGEKVAFVGPTGAGKSTLASLIPRFVDPDAGRVLIDGHDLRALRVESVRRQVALVLQEPFLFPISIAENIAYGRPDASQGEIEAAARAANAHEFISQLPDGYDTVVGERGSTLSGGERQRVSIARAILKDAPILILDEPTSALDAGSEAIIMEALHKLMQGRTTFIIAHRLATVQNADRIFVLDQGSIIETGTHRELLQQSGLYARFCAFQFSEFSKTAEPHQ